MNNKELAFVLGLINGIIAVLAAIVMVFMPLFGPFFTVFYFVAAVFLLVGAFQVRSGHGNPGWVLLLIGGIMTLFIGVLGIVAALKARNVR